MFRLNSQNSEVSSTLARAIPNRRRGWVTLGLLIFGHEKGSLNAKKKSTASMMN